MNKRAQIICNRVFLTVLISILFGNPTLHQGRVSKNLSSLCTGLHRNMPSNTVHTLQQLNCFFIKLHTLTQTQTYCIIETSHALTVLTNYHPLWEVQTYNLLMSRQLSVPQYTDQQTQLQLRINQISRSTLKREGYSLIIVLIKTPKYYRNQRTHLWSSNHLKAIKLPVKVYIWVVYPQSKRIISKCIKEFETKTEHLILLCLGTQWNISASNTWSWCPKLQHDLVVLFLGAWILIFKKT